jgi:glyoxylase-like metal-dependent hydrolase (beta-lactamase superfamily II)
MDAECYELYAVRYGRHERDSSANYIGGDPHDVSEPIDYFVWAIVGEQATYIVDTGFDDVVASKRGRDLISPVSEGLAALGVELNQIRDVIVTHMHFDHAGNLDLFPNARFHMQDAEMEYATGRCMCFPSMNAVFEVDQVVATVRAVFDGRVAFHNGDSSIAPGISVHRIGGHSKGLQCVRVNTKRGPVVLASDASHLYAHFQEGRIFPITYNVAEVMVGYETLRKLAPSDHHIIPGHDPLVLERYPTARPGLENWVARLDIDPVIST